jgi:hypothetical protein
MSTSSSTPLLSPERLAKAYSYPAYRQMLDEQLAAGKTTGPEQTPELLAYEGWCGDAAQTLPVMEAVAQASAGHLHTAYLLRDENPDLIDQYLTNGSRSIPKLLVLHADTLTEVTHWGPRPAEAQALIVKLKGEGMAHDDFIKELHTWYAHDRTQATQHELLALVKQLA